MPDIHVLAPILANQIAAGEVVERPASIVKELVENSIDAGASCISVSITDGGISSIFVTDNGCGIKNDQCQDAFLRHATSKISTVDDLSAIESLGFRGEALASIAAVSSVTMTTRTADSDMGTCICVDGGETLFCKPIACTCGTSIKVENLFAKVPARLRFLKASRFEAGSCADYMSRMILAHPEISFRYSQDGKTIYESCGDGDLKNAVFSVYGNHIYSHLLSVDFDDGYIKVDGFLGTQEVSHANRNLESFFVNGRYIRSNQLSSAVESAFLTKIMIGRHPFCLIRLTIAPKEIDVNVHPSKTQIRFINESRVCEAVSRACTESLKPKVIPKFNIPVSMQPQTAAKVTAQTPTREETPDLPTVQKPEVKVSPQAPIRVQPVNSPASQKPADTLHYYKAMSGSDSTSDDSAPYKNASSYTYNDFIIKDEAASAPVYAVSSSSPKKNDFSKTNAVQESLPIPKEYKVVGCAFNSYWIIEYDSDLYLIDQHAACERKLYERIISEEQGIVSQPLLLPVELTLPPNDFELAKKYRPELEKLGFRFSDAAALTLSVEAVPLINGQIFSADYICEAIDSIEQTGKAAPKDLIYEALVSASCKHSIKAGDRISEKEMVALIDQFIENSIPLTCPHGRPVMIKLSKKEIEKGFKRIV